jgi:hypothetical protein
VSERETPCDRNECEYHAAFKDECMQIIKTANDAYHAAVRQRDDLADALRKLVRLKDIHDRIDKYERMLSDQSLDEYLAEREEYKRCKPLAWDNARAILARSDAASNERGRG